MATIPALSGQPGRNGHWPAIRKFAGRLAAGAISVLRGRSALAAGHLRDHAYSIAGFGFISAAAFVHSVFSGLLVLGVSTFIFEWKVSD